MKTKHVVLIVIGLFILAMGWQAWLDSRIASGHMFAVRTEYTVTQPMLTTIGDNDLRPVRTCRLAPDGQIFIVGGDDQQYVAIYFRLNGARSEGDDDICRHQTLLLASAEDIQAACGDIFERASGLVFGR